MSEAAKAARSAMKSKAERLTKADPSQKVDSSTWSPPEALDADVKTGARPLVKRLYKKGGKVIGKAAGEASKARADRTARKSGGRIGKEAEDRSKRYLTPDNLINRDVRMANDAREGKKHVGAFKKGGKTFPDLTGDGKVTKADVLKGRGVIKTGGKVKKLGGGPIGDNPISAQSREMGKAAGMMKKGGRAHREEGGKLGVQDSKAYLRDPYSSSYEENLLQKRWEKANPETARKMMSDKENINKSLTSSGLKKGGAAKKNHGGSMTQDRTPRNIPAQGGMVPASKAQWKRDLDADSRPAAPTKSPDYPDKAQSLPRKKGGKVANWEGSKKDEAQDRMLAKKYGISMEKWEKSEKDKKHDKQQSMEGLKKGGRTAKYSGGGVFTGSGYPSKVPGVTGGRIAKAKGGSRSAIGKEFDEEFRKNLDAGNKTFEFRGKTYSTKLDSGPTSSGPTRRGMGSPTGRMGTEAPLYREGTEGGVRAPAYTPRQSEVGLYMPNQPGVSGNAAINLQRQRIGAAPPVPNVGYGEGAFGFLDTQPVPAVDGRMGRGLPSPAPQSPNVTYGGGQYGPSADPASRIAAPAPAPAPMGGMYGRGQPSHSEPGLFGGRPGAYGEKAINFSREVPDYPASSFLPRKSGGRTKGKGKTNINIVIAAGRHLGDQPAPNAPVPAPRAMPMPPMPPQGMPPMPPAGGPQDMPMPMPRKSGGRTVHVIDHAAGGGLGRMEKVKAYGHKAGKVVGKK